MKIADHQNFKPFFDLYIKNPDRVVFFVGAGLSLPLFPSWQNFLKQLIIETAARNKLNFDEKELLDKIDGGRDFLEIANYCARAIGKNEYRELIEKNFDKEFGYDDVPSAYKLLLTLQFKSILTTNYDRIPEIGGRGNFNCYTNKNISEALRAFEQGKKIVIKVHGDILNQDSIVLTNDDFNAVIHNNPRVQNALKSLFSTTTICFIGFSFTDPHFNLILDFLSSINAGQNITHYALLASKTKFEINSIETKYGIRVIEYSALSRNHVEVEEFLNHLKGIKTPANPNLIIDSREKLLSVVEDKLQSNLGLQSYFLDYSDETKTISLHYFGRANTEYELQKEILSIYNIFDFETSLVAFIKTCFFAQTEKNIEFIKYSPLTLTSNGKYSNALSLSRRELNEIDFWKTLKFTQPYMIGNIHFADRDVNFPFMNF